MTDLAVIALSASVAAGAALSALHYRRRGLWERSLLIFFLPVLAYFLWHFSVEAYGWGELWKNAPTATLEMAISVALVDMKLLFSILLILVWIYVWSKTKN